MERAIKLYTEENCYRIEGNSDFTIFRGTKPDILFSTPEFPDALALSHESIRGFTLDEQTLELSVEFLRGKSKLEKIDIGIVDHYDSASKWVNAVNELYHTGD